MNGHEYRYQNRLVTEYGTFDVPAYNLTFGTSSTPVDILITNGTVDLVTSVANWGMIQCSGTVVRVVDAYLCMNYVTVDPGTLVYVSGPTSTFRSQGYTRAVYGSIIVTNGALLSTGSGLKLRDGAYVFIGPAANDATHPTTLTPFDAGSELVLWNGAKLSNAYIGTGVNQRIKLFGTLTMLGEGNHLWDIYNGTGSFIPSLGVEPGGLLRGNGKLEFTFVDNASLVLPGDVGGIGTLEVVGNFTNRVEGVIGMELAAGNQK